MSLLHVSRYCIYVKLFFLFLNRLDFQQGKWTKICSLHFEPKDFCNYWSKYRSLKDYAVPSIFPFDSATVLYSIVQYSTVFIQQSFPGKN